MSQFVNDRKGVFKFIVVIQQHVRHTVIASEGIGSAGLPFVFEDIDPPGLDSVVHHLQIIFPHRTQTFSDDFQRLLIRNIPLRHVH